MQSRFLLTNDDGFDAPGLIALERAIQGLGERIVVAPLTHRSGCSHQATTLGAMRLSCGNDGRHALDGTPVDCIRIGLVHLAPQTDWVIAGINEGGNLGCDVFMSGTVAAAREAALLGKSSIAISQYRRRREPVDWQQATRWVQRVLEQLLPLPLSPGTFWNVNLPDPEVEKALPKIVFCPADPHPLPLLYRVEQDGLYYQGNYQSRRREPGHDVELCFAGHITVTRVTLAYSVPWPPPAE